jgi:DNA-binding MarR family transcriptional regulator
MLGHPGSLMIGDISKRVLVSGACITVIFDTLEKEGPFERTRTIEDRRVIKVRLTQKGESASMRRIHTPANESLGEE